MTDIIAPPTISEFPPAPQPTDTPAVFDVKAFAKVNADVAFVPQANALATNVFNNATAAFERTVIAQAAAVTATTQADAAMGYRNAAQASATAAGNSAVLAGTHASTATTALTAMQVMYLGAKAVASHPAVDNMGNPLQAGALYTNTGTNAALNKRGWWWDGAMWQLAWGEFSGAYLPITGGVLQGPLSVPANATGNQVPRANEVMLKAPEAWGKEKLMGDLGVGYALITTSTGRGADWPVDGYDENFQAWRVETTGYPSLTVQTATQVFTTELYARTQGSTWMRCRQGSTWGAWDRVITARTAMDQQVTVNVPSGTSSYLLDPGLGGSHVVTINGTCTFSLPQGRQYGDQVTLDVISAGAIRSIGFSANVSLPKDSGGNNLPFPTYSAGAVVSFVFRYILVNRWECYYAGVH